MALRWNKNPQTAPADPGSETRRPATPGRITGRRVTEAIVIAALVVFLLAVLYAAAHIHT